MIQKILRIIMVIALIASASVVDLMAQNAESAHAEQAKSSPFLITNQLPHLTKLLMQQWDNPTLNLSETQKPELLVIRKKTLGAVKALGPQIAELEEQVSDGIFSKKTPDELKSLVAEISKLKADATMVQLQCIYSTSQILTPEQLSLLMDL